MSSAFYGSSFTEIEDINFDKAIATDETLYEQYNSKFTGVGPQFGFESVYHIGHCFGLVASGAFGLLVGENQTNTNFSGTKETTTETTQKCCEVPGLDEPVLKDAAVALNNLDGPVVKTVDKAFDVNSIDTMRVVPVIDAKLGLNYTHVLMNESVLTLEGGYQLTQYIDAVDRLTPAIDSDHSNIEYAKEGSQDVLRSVTVDRTTSSAGFHGPYLQLNWKI